MKTRIAILPFGLVIALLGSCAPAQPSAPTIQLPTATVVNQVIESTPQPQVTTEAPTQAVIQVVPEATSRGPNLEATDPTTVSLASGSLQLVEFFRFT